MFLCYVMIIDGHLRSDGCSTNGSVLTSATVTKAILSMPSNAIVFCWVKSLIPGVNCTEKYTAINQRQLGAGSGPMDVQFASCG